MRSRRLVAGLALGLLAATVPGALSGPAVADADGTVVDSVALRGDPLGWGGTVPMALSADGRTLVTVTSAGIAKHLVTRRSIVRAGSSASAPDHGQLDVEVLPDGRFAYVTDARERGGEPSRMQVFDLREKRPRLVRTLTFRALARVHGTEITPDGRRLFLATHREIQVLRLGNHPARPRKGPTVREPGGTSVLTIAPDGTRMVTGSGAMPGTQVVRVWDISRPGGPVIEREGTMLLPSGEDEHAWISKLMVSPQGDAIYVESAFGQYGDGDTFEITRLRFSDLATEAQTPLGPGGPHAFLEAVNAAGSRVFVRTGYTIEESVILPRDLAWLDPGLSSSQPVAGVGNVRGVVVASTGRSRGTVFVAGRKDHRLRIYAVRF